MKQPLYGRTLAQLTQIVGEFGLPKFTARQLCDWLYSKHANDLSEMTNLSKKAREALSQHYEVGRTAPLSTLQSVDGTKKYLFAVGGGYVETAYIPDQDRATLCVSSQVGCRMGCVFCQTGKQGFSAQLSAGEILNQMASIPEAGSLTNIVYMGMGEPLDNLPNVLQSIEILTSDWGYGWSPRRITVSTVGLGNRLDDFLSGCEAHLAISLHNAVATERAEIMPMQKTFPIAGIVQTLKKYNWSGQRRLSFEYTMFDGQNDTPSHVKAISTLLGGINCRINIIGFNAIDGSALRSTTREGMERFRQALTNKGFTATIRQSKGADIEAACGLLSTRERQKTLSIQTK